MVCVSHSCAACSVCERALCCSSAPPATKSPKSSSSQIAAGNTKRLHIQLALLRPRGSPGAELRGDVVEEALGFIVEALRAERIIFSGALMFRVLFLLLHRTVLLWRRSGLLNAVLVFDLFLQVILVELSIRRFEVEVRLELQGGGFGAAYEKLPLTTVPGPAGSWFSSAGWRLVLIISWTLAL